MKREWFILAGDESQAHFLFPSSVSPTACGIEDALIDRLAPIDAPKCHHCLNAVTDNPILKEHMEHPAKEFPCFICGTLCDGTIQGDDGPVCMQCGLKERLRERGIG